MRCRRRDARRCRCRCGWGHRRGRRKGRSCRLRARRHWRSRWQDHKNLELIGIRLVHSGCGTTIARKIPLYIDCGDVSIKEHGWHAEVERDIFLLARRKHFGRRGIAKKAVAGPAEIRSPADRHGLLLSHPILDRAVTLVLHLNQEQGAPVVNPTRSFGSIDRRYAKIFRECCHVLRQCRRSGGRRRRHRWGGRRDGYRLGFFPDGVVGHNDAQHVGGRD